MPACVYPHEMTLGEARAQYFEQNNFGTDGGYGEWWIKVKVWRLPIWLPNTAGRVRAVKLHDLHHVLTEYPTTWRGEAEISAWEIGAGGLRKYYAGWWLDIMNVAQGLVVNPVGVYCAFMRGRQSSNLYATEFDDEILTHLVGEYRWKLHLDASVKKPKAIDQLTFVFWVLMSIAVYFGSLLIGIAPLIVVGMLIFSLWTKAIY